ncbi:MAG: nucleotide exchange factor GrpE [Caldiserica bacterium]|nr:MAG: nucleotide exchange factor GrpE [Caldisericota bacterium]
MEKEERKEEGKEFKEEDYFKKRIEELEKEVKEWKDKYLRALADFKNYKDRVEKDIVFAKEEGKIEVILEILSSIDNFERALSSINDSSNPENIKEGIELVFKKLNDDLKRIGVSKIDALGKEFDPQFHYAIERKDVEKDEDVGKVIEVLQPGYIYNEKVIRPAIVVVGKKKEC